ncbi:UDP-N-acetylglucosamine 2-epimerase [Geomonas paludis]|uniref:UDP-N-acetylglucosamine 2-epimerase n=1 Tax=Geomonas paludis TaxID=2740185 RepID=A0ABY4LET9_9BACT|nr:UDP-N-acetylglucosamine 2-epimerase [Geomonas paludis]UPU36497.1 UDP-N-acetylglucosamine 2-epimerase [Geomonas paludis]
MARKVLFLTGTRADFGKLKSLMHALDREEGFEVHVFVTGMHVLPKYGNTGDEVEKAGFQRIFKFINQKSNDSMDNILANTIQGLSNYVDLTKPDLMVIHGDRAEALAGAIVGAFNNILVAHIEGGEVSGTIDESIRHSISKLAHLHFVANDEAKARLMRMGEPGGNIFTIGSPDLDLMMSDALPSLAEVKERYEIPFEHYGIFTYHPVTTSLHNLLAKVKEVKAALLESGRNYVVIYPNNDPGSEIIIEELEALRGNPHFRIFPSVRFEAFLVLLKHADFMIGNSSAAVREAPFYGVCSINIGTRQDGRCQSGCILNVHESRGEVMAAIEQCASQRGERSTHFGHGNSTDQFVSLLKDPRLWEVSVQKRFADHPEAA